jgi:hypothetical protein
LVALFTTLSTGKIKINAASADGLQIIPGLSPMIAEAIVAGREGDDEAAAVVSSAPTNLFRRWKRFPKRPEEWETWSNPFAISSPAPSRSKWRPKTLATSGSSSLPSDAIAPKVS